MEFFYEAEALCRIIRVMDRIAVLIPCYNEALTIGKVVADARRYLPEATIYVYDNNSSDDTAKIAKEAGAIVRHETRQGKGNVIRSMFHEVDALCYIMVDGDDTYGLETASEMARRVLEDHEDMVIGDRLHGDYYTENKRPFHNVGNNLVRSFVNGFFHGRLSDIMTGYRAFSFAFAKSFPCLSSGFQVETEMSIFALERKLKVSQLVIDYRDRPKGSFSKLHTVRDGIRVLRMIAKEFRKGKPFAFYGILSLIFLGLGIGLIVPVFMAYLETGRLGELPMLVGASFSLFLGILLFFYGLLLSNMRQKEMESFVVIYNLLKSESEKK